MKEKKQTQKIPKEKKLGGQGKKRITKDKNPQGTAFDLSSMTSDTRLQKSKDLKIQSLKTQGKQDKNRQAK